MKKNQESGNITFNILLIIMFIIIAVLIYILAGGKIPKFTKNNTGVQSPEMPIVQPSVMQQSACFSDGLTKPDFSEQYPLNEFGEGVSERDIFDVDVNGDGQRDRITRTRNDNGTSHFYYQYKIELNKNGNFVDITPDGFRTTEGSECALQKLQFKQTPEFSITKISRKWQDSWDTPTMAEKTVYKLDGDKLVASNPIPMKIVCNVEDLF